MLISAHIYRTRVSFTSSSSLHQSRNDFSTARDDKNACMVSVTISISLAAQPLRFIPSSILVLDEEEEARGGEGKFHFLQAVSTHALAPDVPFPNLITIPALMTRRADHQAFWPAPGSLSLNVSSSAAAVAEMQRTLLPSQLGLFYPARHRQ